MGWVSIPARVGWHTLAASLAIPAFPLAFLERVFERSATYEVYLRYGAPKVL